MGEGYVKVMTDEQVEVLRRQISEYAIICEQLVQMHKSITAQNDNFAGTRLSGFYADPTTPGGNKLAGRQRWTPTTVQLQILESIFDQGHGTPSKQKIKDITRELTHHGQISETNVYNWFQNRRARSKRKQTNSLPNNTESEPETEFESPSEKKINSRSATPNDNSNNNIEVTSETKSSTSTCQMPIFDNMLPNSGVDHLIGKFEMPERHNGIIGDSYNFLRRG